MNGEYRNNELDSVSKKILEDANLEREKILDEARKKANAIIEEARRDREKILEESRKRAEERYKEVYNLEIMKAKSEFNRRLLLLKLNYVDEVINLAKQRLSNIEREKYILFLRKAIKDLEIKGGEYSIGYKEATIDDELVKMASENLNLKKSDGKVDFEKGVKIVSENGKVEYYISPESVIDSHIEDLRMEVAHFLFDKKEL